MFRVNLIAALAAYVTLASACHATEPEARDLAQRFLRHISANVAIAGTFEIQSIGDPQKLEAFRKAARESAEKEGYGVSFGPDRLVLHCKWAWDGAREMMSTESGSNVWETFYRTPEAIMQGTIKDNFNLDKPSASKDVGPANFYFLSGRLPWSEQLNDCRFRIEPTSKGSPSGSVILVAKSAKTEVHLVVDKEKGVLHGYRAFLPDGALFTELKIEKQRLHVDGRCFPAAARLIVFEPASAKVDTTHILAARDVRFPTTNGEVESALSLTLPKGTLINDFLLSQQIHLKSPASAADVIAGKIPGIPTEFKTSRPPVGRQSSSSSESLRWWGLALLLSLPLATYLAYRGYKLWAPGGDS